MPVSVRELHFWRGKPKAFSKRGTGPIAFLGQRPAACSVSRLMFRCKQRLSIEAPLLAVGLLTGEAVYGPADIQSNLLT